MLKPGYKSMYKLGRSLAQVFGLSTLSTTRFHNWLSGLGLYVADNTACARPSGLFAQPDVGALNPLVSFLYPVSTEPITNTKLIKDL